MREIFLEAIIDNDVDEVKFFIEHPEIDPSENENEAYHLSISHGSKEVREFLENYPKINPIQYPKELAMVALAAGESSIVQDLMGRGLLTTDFIEKKVFKKACIEGDVATIKKLLSNYNVDPSAENQAGYMYAYKNKNFDVCEVLAEDPRVKSTDLMALPQIPHPTTTV